MKASPTKRCRKEPEYTFAEAAWRRAVLRLTALMANAAQRVVMKFMGVRHPREQLQAQLLEVIRGLDDEGLTTARQMLEDAGRARNNDPGSEEWSMVDEMEVAEPVEPRKRRVPETEEQYPNYPGTGTTQVGEDPMLLQPRGRDHPHKEARTECASAVRSLPLVERPREKMPVLPLASGRAAGHVGVEHTQLPEEPIEKSLGEASKLARPEQVQGFTKRVRFVDESKHGGELGNHSLPSQERDLCRIQWDGSR